MNDIAEHLLSVISESITNHPRTLQKKVGPSELGTPCTRRLGYKLLGIEPVNTSRSVNWKATVGTAIHRWLETVFDANNLAVAVDGKERWLIETRVSVGEVNGTEVTGSCDLYDIQTGTVCDWKTTTPAAISKYRVKGPGEQYRAQAHLYARGWQRAGQSPQRVTIVFLPRNGELSDAYAWSEPYDESIALAALERASGVSIATSMLGPAVLDTLPTADAFCTYCPYYKAGSTTLASGCPGDPIAIQMSNATRSNQLAGLI